MIPAMMAGIYRKGASASSFSGGFSATSSTANITSSTRTYTLGAGNSGGVRFTGVSFDGTGMDYSKNGASRVAITEGLVISLANTNTLNIRATGLASTQSGSCTVEDYDTGTVLDSTIITRT